MLRRLAPAPLLLALAGCQSPAGDEPSARPFDDIGAQETIRFTGTEPFWGGEARGDSLTYSTPEEPGGTTIAVRRFTGNSGLGLSGTLDGERFDMVVTRGSCSDGMSDRQYPFTVTLEIGEDARYGCAWTDTRPFTGPDAP